MITYITRRAVPVHRKKGRIGCRNSGRKGIGKRSKHLHQIYNIIVMHIIYQQCIFRQAYRNSVDNMGPTTERSDIVFQSKSLIRGRLLSSDRQACGRKASVSMVQMVMRWHSHWCKHRSSNVIRFSSLQCLERYFSFSLHNHHHPHQP